MQSSSERLNTNFRCEVIRIHVDTGWPIDSCIIWRLNNKKQHNAWLEQYMWKNLKIIHLLKTSNQSNQQ